MVMVYGIVLGLPCAAQPEKTPTILDENPTVAETVLARLSR